MAFDKSAIETVPCPSCHTMMHSQQTRMAVFSICPKCKGVWLDDKMMRRLRERVLEKSEDTVVLVRAVADEKLVSCPACEKEMDKRFSEDVILDICPKCKGVWFDGGEFEQVFHFDPETGSYTLKEKTLRALGRTLSLKM